MNNNPFSISVSKNSNRIIASSEVDWSGLREGSFIRIKGDKVFYTIGKIDKIYLIKDFICTGPTSFDINSSIGNNLSIGDILTLSYKEYEVDTIWSILSEGRGYKKDEIIHLTGGKPSLDSTTGINKDATFKVKSVGPIGEIKEISLVSKGEYLETPPKESDVSGFGSDAKFEVTYKIIDNRKTIERVIDFIDIQTDVAHLVLNYSLPRGITQGKLSVEKWEVYITSNYLGESKVNAEFEIIKDFTPIFRLPLLAENSFSHELTHNHAIVMLENKIAELEDRLNQLSPKV